MSVRVVDALEIVDINHRNRQRRFVALGALELITQCIQSVCAAVSAGQRVCHGECLKLRCAFLYLLLKP